MIKMTEGTRDIRLYAAEVAADFASLTIQAQEESSHSYAQTLAADIAKDLMGLAVLSDKQRREAATNTLRARLITNANSLHKEAAAGHNWVRSICEKAVAVVSALA